MCFVEAMSPSREPMPPPTTAVRDGTTGGGRYEPFSQLTVEIYYELVAEVQFELKNSNEPKVP